MGNRFSAFLKRSTRLRFILIFSSLMITANFAPNSFIFLPDINRSVALAEANHSDINGDGVVNEQDLIEFSDKALGQDWQSVDWCLWIQNRDNIEKYGDKYRELFDFIHSYYQCDQPPTPPPSGDKLTVLHANERPLRLAFGPNDKLYVSDAQVGSVFIYDITPDGLSLIGELKGIDDPLGVAVDSLGNIYVGSGFWDRVEVYDPAGNKIREIGTSILKMPNDLAFDRVGNLYVVDSEGNRVYGYNPNGEMILRIGSAADGNARFRFPVSLTIWYGPDGSGEIGELYVGEMTRGLVQVFDLQGNFLRSYGGQAKFFGGQEGLFARLQSLALHLGTDGNPVLHVLDSHFHNIQMLDPATGDYIGVYGSHVSLGGQLRLPFDILIDHTGLVYVANYGNKNIELLSVP